MGGVQGRGRVGEKGEGGRERKRSKGMGRGRLAILILVCFQRCCNALKEDGDQRIRLQSHQVHLILTHIQLKKSQT